MILRGSHRTEYRYGAPVAFGPHLLYLRPREDGQQRLREYRLSVAPAADQYTVRDAYDNALTWAYVAGPSAALKVETAFRIETRDPGFRFLLNDYAVQFPFAYEPVLAFALRPYLVPPFSATQDTLRAWSAHLFSSTSVDTVGFVTGLNTAIFQALTYRTRDEIGIQPAAETVASGSGSCRDYAVLLVELCRTWGLAARFVSGYLFAAGPGETTSTGPMHAWTEVYLPGAGWLALDPTHGRACDDAYIAVAHAAQAVVVNPIQGAFVGVPAHPPELVTSVTLEREASSAPSIDAAGPR